MTGPVPEIPGYVDVTYLDRGGFGTVYTAVHEHIGWNVAVKVLDQVLSADPTVRDRFRRETRLMGTLDGAPHIVAIKHADLVPATGAPYLVMRLMEGGSLASVLRRRGTLTSGEVVKVGFDISGALAAARAHNIIHRDVKPANILLDAYGEAYIADFGIAVTTDVSTSADTRAQMSLEHAPPERLDGRSTLPGTHAGDVYSLASTLLTLLLGEPPFGSSDVGIGELARRILCDRPPSPRPGEVSPGLVAVIHAAMAKDPDARPAATAFASQLQAVVRDERLTPVPIALHGVAAGPAPGGAATTGPDRPPPVPDTIAGAWGAAVPGSVPGGVLPMPSPPGPTAVGRGAGDDLTVVRPLTAPEPAVPSAPPTRSRTPLVVALAIAAVVAVGGVAALVTRGSGDDAGTSSSTTSSPSSGELRPEPPVVEALSATDGLEFTWTDPNETTTDPALRSAYAAGQLNYLTLVTVDGTSADPTEFQRDGTGGYRTTQRIDEISINGTPQPIDLVGHEYCVSMLIFSEGIEGPNPWVASPPRCE